MNFKTQEELTAHAKKLSLEYEVLVWLDSDAEWNKLYLNACSNFEGEGLYEVDYKTHKAEFIYNPATDISFEWGGVEYCFECPQCAELFDTIYCENCLPKFAFAMRSCWECNTGHEHLKREKGLFWCLECDRYYEEGVFL